MIKKLMEVALQNKARRTLAFILALVVTFTTTYSLILPAITLEKDTAETMSGVDLGSGSGSGDTASASDDEGAGDGEDASDGDDSPTSEPRAFDAEAREDADDGDTHTVQVHVEADADAFPEGTTMSAEIVTDQAVLDTISDSVDGEVTAVHAVEVTFTTEDGEPVQPAEGSQVSVTLSAGTGEDAAAPSVPAGDESAPDAQPATETTVVQVTEDQSVETLESTEGAQPQVEPEMDMDTDNAVSFDVPEPSVGQETQTFALVETVSQEGSENQPPQDQEEAGEEKAEDPKTAETPTEEVPAEAPPVEELLPQVPVEELLPQVPVEEEFQAGELVYDGNAEDYLVTVTYGPEACIPQGATLSVRELEPETDEYDEHMSMTQTALDEAAQPAAPEGIYAGPETEEEPAFFGVRSLMADPEAFDRSREEPASTQEIVQARFFDITILFEGEKVNPAAAVSVSIQMQNEPQDEQSVPAAEVPQVVHFGDDATEVVDASLDGNAVNFETTGFSVFAVVYTVDFSYSVNGKEYEYSLAGGGWIRLTDLVELLGIADGTATKEVNGENGTESTGEYADEESEVSLSDLINGLEVSEETTKFVADVTNVEFSNPALLDVSRADTDTTVGEIRVLRGLEVQYSAELTEEQIVELEQGTVKAGDWLLLSLQPFDTEETLTVTMANGEQFSVKVTDAAISYSNVTTVHYGYEDENGVFVEFPDSMKPSSDITGLSTSFGWHYLIYDFYGEETDGNAFQWKYKGTYYNANGETTTPGTSGTPIQPALRYRNWGSNWQSDYGWRYFDQFNYTNTSITNNANWKSVSNSSDIYVVYEKPTITNGGAPTLKVNAALPDEPDILKQSVENGDGTNTLSLSITGSTAPMEVEKLADVIVILDLSSSMRRSIGSENEHSNYTTNSDSRYYQAKLAIQNLANKLYQRNTDAGTDLYRMGLVTFSNDATIRQELTENKDTFQVTLNGITQYESNGTNWEYALQLANQMSVDPGRATYIIFVTDGDPTLRQTRWELKDTQLTGNAQVVEGDLYYGGLQGGAFGGDNSRLKFRDYFGSATFGGLWTPHFDIWDWRNQHACYDEVQSMEDHNKNFYAIGISSAVSVESLDGLVTQAGLSSDHSTVETTGTGLANAFETFLSVIDGETGQAKVEIFDGITDLTQTISKVNQEENRLIGADGNFTYWKSNAPANWSSWSKEEKSAYTVGMKYAGSDDQPEEYDNWTAEEKAAFAVGQNVTFTEWTTRAADGCAEAVYNTETGAVEWNMGDKFMLEDGVTYKVSFICWPSQEAYDIIAKLNNRTITYGDTEIYSQEVWDQFEGDAVSGYTLKTNAEGAHTTYSTATRVNGKVTVGEEQPQLPFQHVPPMPLDKDKLNVAKKWQASRIDSQNPEEVVIQVVGGNEVYKQFIISPNETVDGSSAPNAGRYENIYISCGHLKVNKNTGEVVIYESGHDFSLREVEENSRHWDLSASICRPMRINMEETMLVLVDEQDIPQSMPSSANYYDYDDEEYYRIGGKVYRDTHEWADITGENTRRSFLDLAKEVVVDGEVWPEAVDTKFTYRIKIDIDPTTLSWDPNLEKYIIISIRGDGYSPAAAIADETYPTTAKLPTLSGMPESLIHERYDEMYLVAESGVEFYLSIKNGWSVRFLNLPAGTTYTISEVLADDAEYSFDQARLEIRKDRDAVNPESTEGYNTPVITGSIAETSTLYKLVYQNAAIAKKVRILKTGQDTSTLLSGAKFDLYTEKAYTSDPKGSPMKTGLVSSGEAASKGQIDLGSLPIGKYYLVETEAPDGYNLKAEPVVINVSKTTVTYEEGTSLSSSGAGNGISQIDDIYQLTVTNDAGYELPSTGGPGTRHLTLLGALVLVGAGAALVTWRRKTS